MGCFIISASGGLYVNCISLLIMGATNCGPDSLLGGSISMEVSSSLVFVLQFKVVTIKCEYQSYSIILNDILMVKPHDRWKSLDTSVLVCIPKYDLMKFSESFKANK